MRFRRPKDPAVQRGGECYKDCPGLGNRSIFYPYRSVGNTFTLLYRASSSTYAGGLAQAAELGAVW